METILIKANIADELEPLELRKGSAECLLTDSESCIEL